MENVAALDRQRQAHPVTTGVGRARSIAGRWTERVALAVVYLVSLGSLVGFATFHLNPQLLNEIPGAAQVYGRMFVVAPRAQIALAFLALAVFLTWRVGLRWLPAFVAVYLLSLGSELAGTTVGLPFGPYRYTDGLGVKLFEHVPVLIPISWFFMALPSYALALRRYPAAGDLWKRVLVGSFVLLAWDLALDPAMSIVTKYWIWGTEGAYYGMPLLNLFGWYVTGLVLMAAIALVRSDGWVAELPLRWLLLYYAANLLLPLGMSVAAGLWGVVVATGLALLLCWWVTRHSPATATGAPAPREVAG